MRELAAKKKSGIKRETIALMKTLGVYKEQYDPIIEIYAELREQYAALTKQFENSGYAFEVETMQGGAKKAPIVATLESLRKDILAYADRLCLNPKIIDGITVETKKKSALAAALSAIEK
ncbi:P27 family phage terminase small subunit [Paenibacillus ehimensis]|uniref:P27 family phage terminase small subunit n=1 Tax=Paenibacillus ehimensis TaxID=79264 RepID=UPI003898FDC4